MDAGDSLALVIAKASGAIAAAGGTFNTVLNTIKAVGPYAVAQWDQVSLAQAKHNARLAVVETGKDFLKQELGNYAEVSKELLSEYATATPRRKLLIQKDLEYLDQRVRQINIGILAIGYTQTNGDNTEKTQSEDQVEVSPHWVDKFNELARSHNEGWRAELLARALATESASPGTVSPRVLWFLGTLEETMFHAFGALLDLCSDFGGHLAIPNYQPFNTRHLNSSGGLIPDTIGGLTFALGELGVLAELLQAVVQFDKCTCLATYAEKSYAIKSPETTLEIRGILLTVLGKSVAQFCDRKPNPLGQEILEAFLSSLDKAKYTVRPLVRVGSEWHEESE